MKHPIAIVGLGCRFAGAPDAHAYWQMTVDGRDGFGPVPADRWSHEQFFDTNPRAIDKSYAPNGGFIEDLRSFPALTLGIPPRRVEVMDPQQRFSIEVALAAIQDAGYRIEEMPRRTGVYMGVTASEWRLLASGRITAAFMASGTFGEAPEDLDALASSVSNITPSRPFTAPGSLANMIAAAVAQELDLHGPAYTVDSACASALIALSNAVSDLRSGAVDAALAGGVYLCMTPVNHVAFSRIGAISKSGVCRPFDSRADGFVQGDGAGTVVLKRLEDAQRDGDRIYAVIRGVATNNDGRGDGPMAPVLDGQLQVMADAWSNAAMQPEDLGYVETHGTGTLVGDATEFSGLMRSFGEITKSAAIGSSKGNVGHTMSAAGIAGVIRTALAIHHRTIPPMAGFESTKSDVVLDGTPFRIPTTAEAWTGRRLGAVSSFGFGGTNAHIVLDEAPEEREVREQPELLLLSAKSAASLRTLASRTADYAERTDASPASVARALAVRTPLEHRLGLVASSTDEMVRELRLFAENKEHSARIGRSKEEPKVAWMFPGQGAQRIDMLADARQRFPIIADTLTEVEAAIKEQLPLPLTQLIYPSTRLQPVDDDTAQADLTDTAHCQPAMFACSLALSRLLQSVGAEPSMVTGHSLGEFNAAVLGEVISAGDAARFVAARGHAMSTVHGDPGKMAAVMADRRTVEELLDNGAVIANVNHPRQVVVSGPSASVDHFMEVAAQNDVEVKPLPVSHAFHSPVFSKLDTASWLEGIELHDPTIPVVSCIAGHPYQSAAEARSIFERHATSPVEFVRALEDCVHNGADLLLQVGAGGPLASFARGSVGQSVRGIQTLGGRKDFDGGASLLEGLSWLWVNGVNLDVRPITAPAVVASIPAEDLPKEAYWVVKDRAQRQLKLKAIAAQELERADEPTEEVPAPSSLHDDVAKVMAVVAQVSAYPIDALKPTMRLIDDLGFDSLMVGDLATGLSKAFPGVGGIPQELLINGPTVQDLIDFATSEAEGPVINDDDPVEAYQPVWIRAERLGEQLSPKRAVAFVHGSAAGLDASLQAHKVERSTDSTEPADVIIWIADGDESGALIALLSEQLQRGASPALIVLATPGDIDAEALAGVARAYGAERDVVSKCIWAADATELIAEWIDAEQTSDVRFISGFREILGLTPAPVSIPVELGAGDVVLITGGTRGIGRKLGERLASQGCTILAVGRGACKIEGFTTLQADVTDAQALAAATAGYQITAVVHAAGVLADGPVETVDSNAGALCRAIKVQGWENALAVAPNARVAIAIGSWAGRFGNRHQVHYAAANAHLAARVAASNTRAVIAEFGPWSESEMVSTIPTPIQATMRTEGVDFVTDRVGIDTLLEDLRVGVGIRTHGRSLPSTTRKVRQTIQLSTRTHPFLLDHAIEGTPVLPLASATDYLATASGLRPPFEIVDLRLFQGVTVKEPTTLEVRVRGDRAEIRVGTKKSLAYRARVRPFTGELEIPTAPVGGDAPSLTLKEFYSGITFHGELLQGITSIDAVGESFVRGAIHTGTPKEWERSPARTQFTVDPLALDSAMQLSGYVAWTRFERAGTPVGIGRLVQLAPLPDGELSAEVHFGDREDNRFSGTIVLRDHNGKAILVALDTVAELRKLTTDGLGDFEIKDQWVDFSSWQDLKDLDMRLEMAQLSGIRNPYFAVHDGTARNVTSVQGRELINFSSYNYLGLSGDERVVEAAQEAVAKFGTSVSASRVASGERPFHGQLEKLLAQCQDVEDTLVFTAGHATNVTAIGHLMGPKDLVLHDELIHDSILQGIKLAGCARRGFSHDDARDLESQLSELRTHYEKVLIVVEGVYSMDGDICDLPSFIALKKKYGCLLMCDEAHSFGVVGERGQGVREHWGIPGSDVDIWMGTLSKSLASCGGWIGGSAALIRYLRYTAPGFVYSAGITPANGVSALTSLRLMLEERWRVEKLQQNARLFHDELQKRGIDTGPALGGSAVVPAVTGNSLHALYLSQRLIDAGINVQPIVFPAVADDAARLRFFLSSTHTDTELIHTAEQVAQILKGVRADFPIPGM